MAKVHETYPIEEEKFEEIEKEEEEELEEGEGESDVERESEEHIVKRRKHQWSAKKCLMQNGQVLLKIQEVVLCGLCIGFAYEPIGRTEAVKYHLHHIGIMYTAYCGYILINMILLVGHLAKDRIPFKTYAIFNMIGTVLFLLTAILLTIDRKELKKSVFQEEMYLLSMLTISITFAFINAGTFAVDAIFTLTKLLDF